MRVTIKTGGKVKALTGALAGLGVLGILLGIGLFFGALICSLYGLYLAFSASIVLGIIVFFVEPAPLVIGLVMIGFHMDIAQRIVEFFNK